MKKNKPKAREILLAMLWSLESVSKGCCISTKRMSRKQFARKYNCRDENGTFV